MLSFTEGERAKVNLDGRIGKSLSDTQTVGGSEVGDTPEVLSDTLAVGATFQKRWGLYSYSLMYGGQSVRPRVPSVSEYGRHSV